MNIAERSKRKRLALALTSLTVALLGTALMAITSMIPLYPLMLSLIPVTALGYYVMAFAFPAYSRMKIYIRIIKAVEEEGKRTYSDIAQSAGVKEKYLQKCLTKCVGRRYLTRFGFGGDGLVEV